MPDSQSARVPQLMKRLLLMSDDVEGVRSSIVQGFHRINHRWYYC